jgi:transketolase
LSKGHAVLAVYAALFLKGWLTEDDLNTYCSDHSLLGVHPEHALRGVAFSTGLFGHGLSRESLVETALNALSAREVAR